MFNSFKNPSTPQSRQHFGKAIEYTVFGQLMLSGGELFFPAVDDDGVDVLVRRPIDKKYVEVQVKAKGRNAKEPGLFADITHRLRPDYWFVFYSEQLDKVWVLNSCEFVSYATQNKAGSKKAGTYSINFGNKGTRLKKFEVRDFNRILY